MKSANFSAMQIVNTLVAMMTEKALQVMLLCSALMLFHGKLRINQLLLSLIQNSWFLCRLLVPINLFG